MAKVRDARTFSLSAHDIDEFSLWLDRTTADLNVERQNRMRTRLLMEEILLRLQDRGKQDLVVDARVETSFGRPRLRMEVEGEPYNPLVNVRSEMGEWDSMLRTGIGLVPHYNYGGNKNVITLMIPHSSMNAVFSIACAIALGTLLGLAGPYLMPREIPNAVTQVFFTPCYETWLRLLNAMSGPVVFLTVIATMLNMQGIDQKGGNSVRVIVRYFVASIFIVGFATACGSVVSPVTHVKTIYDLSLARGLLKGILNFVPNNILDPFEESNTAQLLFLAFVLGYALIKLGRRVSTLRTGIIEANIVGLKLAEWMSLLVPVFVGAFLCLEMWQRNETLLSVLWQPLVVSLAISLSVLVANILFVAGWAHMSPIQLSKKLWHPFAIALKSGSLDASYGAVQSSNRRYLGIDPAYTREAFPQGLVLYMPVSAIGTIVFTLYAARLFNVEGSTIWLLTASIMAVMVFVATPPVPGANLLAYVVLFNALGISESALIDAMTFDIVFGIFAGAANQAMLQLEMLLQAHRAGMLDMDCLRQPMK